MPNHEPFLDGVLLSEPPPLLTESIDAVALCELEDADDDED